MFITTIVKPDQFNSATLAAHIAESLELGPNSPLRRVLLTAAQTALDDLVRLGVLSTEVIRRNVS